MKSRTSFCNATVLRWDFTRFAPVWGLYTIGFFLLHIVALSRGVHDYERACYMAGLMKSFACINGVYALVVSQALFGDLLNPRMCNAVHALPLTRDDFFVTHALAGFAFSLIPNLLVTAISLPLLGDALPMAFYLLVVMTATYILYYGLALLAVQLAGNRIAGVLIYGLLNFSIVLVIWFAKYFYEPMMYGVDIPIRESLWQLCPTLSMMEKQYVYVLGRGEVYEEYVIRAMARGEGWYGLGIWTVMGLLAMAAAQILYRRRKLETAGDLLAHRGTVPFFQLLYTAMVAGFFHVAAYALAFRTGFTSLLFIIAGMIVGWFTGRMLLMQQVKVFRWRSAAALGGLILLLLVSVWCAAGDVFGVVNRVPALDEIAGVEVRGDYSWSHASIRDPKGIASIRDIQIRELENHKAQGFVNAVSGNENYRRTIQQNGESMEVELTYLLKSGKEMKRTYLFSMENPDVETIETTLSRPEAVLGLDYANLAEAERKTDSVYFYNYVDNRRAYRDEPLPREQFLGLLGAIEADCKAGVMAQEWVFHRDDPHFGSIRIEFNEPDPTYAKMPILEREYRYDGRIPHLSAYVNIYPESQNTIAWLLEHDYITQEGMDRMVQEVLEGTAMG